MTAPVATTPGVLRYARRAQGSIVVILIAGVVGFLVTSQLHGAVKLTQRLQAEDPANLTRILAGLSQEADSLQDESSSLQLQLQELRNSSVQDSAAAHSTAKQIAALEVLAGTVAVKGPGIVVTVSDNSASVHYATFIDVVQELRDAGAEAIAIDGTRVGVNSAFTEVQGVTSLDGVALRSPYKIEAIGSPDTLEGGLRIPGGALDALKALRGVTFDLQSAQNLTLPALSSPPKLDGSSPVISGP